MDKKIARVLVVSQAQNLERLFDYSIPEVFQVDIQVGARVLVPFRNRPNLGFVWELAENSAFNEVKSIQQLLDNIPLLGSIQYQLINWLADYYFCSRADVIKLCLPPGANLSREIFYRLAIDHSSLDLKLKFFFPEEQVATAMSLVATGIKADWNSKEWQNKFGAIPQILEFLIHEQFLIPNHRIAKPKTKPKVCTLYRWSVDNANSENRKGQSLTGRRVQEVLQGDRCRDMGLTAAELCAAAEVSLSVVKRLLKEGQISCFEVAEQRRPAGLEEVAPIGREIQLNLEQQEVYRQITVPNQQQLFLLHGITGSGKTEVYFNAASEVINRGGQVLYLVPEIALTPQTLERARNRFGDQVALIHSNMSDGERYDQWFRVKNHSAGFVLGARSAAFAPFDRLGLIIVDEEHETTYKQEENPRYHIRQVVEKLAELTGAKIIFGSATPSVESFYYAQSGKYRYLQLKQRFNHNPLPEVTMVDMREELHNGNRNILSAKLHTAIEESLAGGDQIILLLNRRGHSTFILCRDCGYTLRCPACDVALTYHTHEMSLRCHYCDYRRPVPDTCPECHSTRIRYFGHGTQKLEEELAKDFPAARIVRMDVDSTAKKGAHQQIYHQLTSGAVDILLGTQMIAKGLDLPRVTLVGVISADSTLNIPDFRAAERTFSLLTQVAGRAGRGQKTGRVIFQAYDPDHYSLQRAKEHDYHGFYHEEIKYRADLHYPPFAELVKFGFSGLNESSVNRAAYEFCRIVKGIQQRLISSNDPAYYMEVLGPGAALVPKIQNNYRWQLLLKSNRPDWLEAMVKEAWTEYQNQKHSDVRVTKDRNPYLVV
jgi:primosomal protein N' (replication factor Y) (superfamily II helicase)